MPRYVMTEKMKAEARKMLAEGMTRVRTAETLGIRPGTLESWLKRERAGKEDVAKKDEKKEKSYITIGPAVRYTVRSVEKLRERYYVGQEITLETTERDGEDNKNRTVKKRCRISEIHRHGALLVDENGIRETFDYVYLAENEREWQETA